MWGHLILGVWGENLRGGGGEEITYPYLHYWSWLVLIHSRFEVSFTVTSKWPRLHIHFQVITDTSYTVIMVAYSQQLHSFLKFAISHFCIPLWYGNASIVTSCSPPPWMFGPQDYITPTHILASFAEIILFISANFRVFFALPCETKVQTNSSEHHTPYSRPRDMRDTSLDTTPYTTLP